MCVCAARSVRTTRCSVFRKLPFQFCSEPSSQLFQLAFSHLHVSRSLSFLIFPSQTTSRKLLHMMWNLHLRFCSRPSDPLYHRRRDSNVSLANFHFLLFLGHASSLPTPSLLLSPLNLQLSCLVRLAMAPLHASPQYPLFRFVSLIPPVVSVCPPCLRRSQQPPHLPDCPCAPFSSSFPSDQPSSPRSSLPLLYKPSHPATVGDPDLLCHRFLLDSSLHSIAGITLSSFLGWSGDNQYALLNYIIALSLLPRIFTFAKRRCAFLLHLSPVLLLPSLASARILPLCLLGYCDSTTPQHCGSSPVFSIPSR